MRSAGSAASAFDSSGVTAEPPRRRHRVPAPESSGGRCAVCRPRLRRERDGELGGRPIRQILFRFGEVIVEAVGSPEAASEGPSTLWGITYLVVDIDATAGFFGDRTAPIKDAVQPGRRNTTLRHHQLGMSVRSAMISTPIL